MAQDLINELTASELCPARSNAVAAGTQSFAGVDIGGYVGKIKCTYSSFMPHEAATNSIIVEVRDSPDNSTFVAYTAVTFTDSAVTGDLTVDTRTADRYIQGAYTFAGTTMTVAIAMTGVGLTRTV